MSRKDRERAERFLRHLEPLQGKLEAYGRRALSAAGELEDALQSAVANAFRDFQLYAEGTNFRAWIFRYFHLEICNRNRKHERCRHVDLPSDLSVEEAWQIILDEPLHKTLLDDPEVVLEQCEAPLARAVRNLPSPERAVFLLHVLGDFKYREIAEILEMPIGSVMGYLARSRLRLRQELVQLGEERGYFKREPRGQP